MLPDLPALKNDIQRLLDRYLRKATYERLGMFAEVPQHTIHEGMEMRVYRADGTVEDSGMKEASAEMAMKYSDVPYMTVADRLRKLDEAAETMAKQMSAQLFSSLNDSLEKAGQVVDGRGRQFDADALFAALETMHIEFDQNGNVKGLKIYVGSDLMPRVAKMIEDEKTDPAIKQRHDEIMARKWQEWRDREASRKLVG